jgi:hypothetical protein
MRGLGGLSVVLVVTLLCAQVGALEGQSEGATLRGMVTDSLTGQTLSAVIVSVDSLNIGSVSGDFGAFEVRPLPVGEHLISFHKSGYLTRSFRFTITEQFLTEVNLGRISLLPIPPHYVSLKGVVTDFQTGEAVSEVPVMVNGTIVAITAPDGTFEAPRVQMPPGANLIEFRRMGYEPLRNELLVEEGATEAALSVTLQRLAVPIEEVVVEGEYEALARGKLRGFYERRGSERGRFITPEEIDDIPAIAVTDILRAAPGVIITPSHNGGFVSLTRVDARCMGQQPAFYLDGAPLRIIGGQSIDQMLNRGDIVAVEVYFGPSQIPLQYRPPDALCGVILLWTRTGAPGSP